MRGTRAIAMAVATLALCGVCRPALPSSIVQAFNFNIAG